MWFEPLIDYKLLPDRVLRGLCGMSIRRYASRINRYDNTQIDRIQSDFRHQRQSDAIAINTNEANAQHYEIPTDLFATALGKRMKYSSSYWLPSSDGLDDAELHTLGLYETRAKLEDGQNVLDLGAGWGSTTLYLAERHQHSQVTAVTNSHTQANFIESLSKKKGLGNVRVVKADINSLSFKEKFDRVIAIEMFEHTRNATELIRRIADWLELDGKLFIQVFSHRFYPQTFDDVRNSWMSRRFFTGGIMPYDGFYSDCNNMLSHVQTWTESGIHYHKTLEAWLRNLDCGKTPFLLTGKGASSKLNPITINRFRMFLITCSELFKFNHGKDWHLINYLFEKKRG